MSAFAYLYTKIDKINDLIFVRKIVKNWIAVILFRIGLKKTLTIKFRDGKTVHFKNMKDYFEFWNSELGQNEILKVAKASITKIGSSKVELNYQNKKVFYDKNRKSIINNGVIKENFIDEQYELLYVKGRDVVDVGANIGDSAIYFALKSAKHVYAFEPYPYSYNIAKKVIKINNLEDKITLLNEGCGKSGFVTIKEDYENKVGMDLKNFQKGKKVRVESLDEIVKRFNLKKRGTKGRLRRL